jgi:hypothetical protein
MNGIPVSDKCMKTSCRKFNTRTKKILKHSNPSAQKEYVYYENQDP